MKLIFTLAVLFLTVIASTTTGQEQQFLEQQLKPLSASTKRPQSWFYREFHRGPVKLWIISKEKASNQNYETGVRIQLVSGISKLIRKSPADFVKQQVDAIRRNPKLKIVVEPKETSVPFGTRISMETEEGAARVAYDFYWGPEELDSVLMLVYGAPKDEWGSVKESLREVANIDPRLMLNPEPATDTPAIKEIAPNELSKLLAAMEYESLALERVPSGHLHLAVRINDGNPLRFLCDSGANITLITPESAKRLKLVTIDTKNTVAGLGGNQQKALMAPITGLTVGDFASEWRSVKVVDISGLNRQFKAAGDKPVDGVLGSDWMEKHAVLIDVAKGRLFFKNNSPRTPK